MNDTHQDVVCIVMLNVYICTCSVFTMHLGYNNNTKPPRGGGEEDERDERDELVCGPQYRFDAHDGAVYGLCAMNHTKEDAIASCGDDGAARLWKITHG